MPALIKPPMQTARPVNSSAYDTPHPYRWTLDGFTFLMETGIISEKCELLEGVIYAKMPTNYPHRLLVSALMRWLASVFGLEYLMVQSSVDFLLPDGSASRLDPDITVLKQPEPTYSHRNPGANDIVLLVEVADSTLPYDSTQKIRTYAVCGVTEYWIVDVNGERIMIHRDPTPNGYDSITVYSGNEEVAPLTKPNAKIVVSALFPTASQTMP